MTLAELLAPGRAILSRAPSKPAILAELSRLASQQLGLAPSVIAQALSAREELGSTGVGGGVALPHARVEGLGKPTCFLAQLNRPADWSAIDGKPVDTVFLLLSPQKADAEHVAALAAMTRRLREPGVAAAIRAATDPADLWRAATGLSG